MSTTFFTLYVLLAYISVSCMGFSFTVPAGKEECFYEETFAGLPVVFMFQVTEGGHLDIDIQIRGPDGRIVYIQERQSEGKYNFQAHTNGRFSFCFGNRMSTVTDKLVSALIQVGKGGEKRDESAGVAKDENITPLEVAIQQLSEGINAIVNEQSYMKMRERAHRNTSESTNARVVWWSIFEIVILLAMSLWQIYYLRRFFEVKRIV